MRSASLTLVVALATSLVGCNFLTDDRNGVSQSIFECDPEAPDAQCGDGFLCWGVTQIDGRSVCTRKCNPNDATTCTGGYCTLDGACLPNCTVDPAKETCPMGLHCVRMSLAPADAPSNVGVCVAVDKTCSDDSACTSPVYDVCSSSIADSGKSGALNTSGSVCRQGGCSTQGTSCVPGSSCLGDILPARVRPPDVCSAHCIGRTAPSSTDMVQQCPPGLTCLSVAFPNTDIQVCTPGFAGWLCAESMNCTVGQCTGWSDVDPALAGLKSCDVKCMTSDDCLPFDRAANPTATSKFRCVDNVCRNLQTLGFADLCVKFGQPCAKLGTCVATDDVALGGFGGKAGICVRACSKHSECAEFAASTHVPHVCSPTSHQCITAGPGAPCGASGDCVPGLTCVGGACNVDCSRRGDVDCDQAPLVSGAFFCNAGICAARKPAGTTLLDAAEPASHCLSGLKATGVLIVPPGGNLDGGVVSLASTCVSPNGWTCGASDSAIDAVNTLNANAQCQSGNCDNNRCQPR